MFSKRSTLLFIDKNSAPLCFECELVKLSHLQSVELLLGGTESCLSSKVLHVQTEGNQARPYPAAWPGSV